MMGTANTMNMLTEALGMTLTDGGPHPGRLRGPHRPGPARWQAILEIHNRNILPRDIMTPKAFENAIAVDMSYRRLHEHLPPPAGHRPGGGDSISRWTGSPRSPTGRRT
jgi:hypothetical protein